MRRLEVTIESRHAAFVRGYGSRALLTELRGRPPVWSTLTRGWVTTAEGARDLVAVAEARGWDVVVQGSTTESDPGTGLHPETTSSTEITNPGRGLW